MRQFAATIQKRSAVRQGIRFRARETTQIARVSGRFGSGGTRGIHQQNHQHQRRIYLRQCYSHNRERRRQKRGSGQEIGRRRILVG